MAGSKKYVFRGTTRGYAGNPSSRTLPRTSTSSHPVIAWLFAMVCARDHPDESVIYVAAYDQIKNHKTEANCIKRKEQELCFEMTPTDFISLSAGHIHYLDLKNIFNKHEINVPALVRRDNLTECCAQVRRLTGTKRSQLMEDILNQLKQ